MSENRNSWLLTADRRQILRRSESGFFIMKIQSFSFLSLKSGLHHSNLYLNEIQCRAVSCSREEGLGIGIRNLWNEWKMICNKYKSTLIRMRQNNFLDSSENLNFVSSLWETLYKHYDVMTVWWLLAITVPDSGLNYLELRSQMIIFWVFELGRNKHSVFKWIETPSCHPPL